MHPRQHCLAKAKDMIEHIKKAVDGHDSGMHGKVYTTLASYFTISHAIRTFIIRG